MGACVLYDNTISSWVTLTSSSPLIVISNPLSDQCWWTMKECLWMPHLQCGWERGQLEGAKALDRQGWSYSAQWQRHEVFVGQAAALYVPQLAISSCHVNKEKTMYVILQGFFQQILIPDLLLFSHNVYSKQLSLASQLLPTKMPLSKPVFLHKALMGWSKGWWVDSRCGLERKMGLERWFSW